MKNADRREHFNLYYIFEADRREHFLTSETVERMQKKLFQKIFENLKPFEKPIPPK